MGFQKTRGKKGFDDQRSAKFFGFWTQNISIFSDHGIDLFCSILRIGVAAVLFQNQEKSRVKAAFFQVLSAIMRQAYFFECNFDIFYQNLLVFRPAY